MDRKEFRNFVRNFGRDEDMLCFRLRHDFLSSKECWSQFGHNNAVNLVIEKKQLIHQLDKNLKVEMLQEGTLDRWFDIEQKNNEGFAVFILPNLAHRKADITKAYTHVWDYDCGKEIYDVDSLEEAERFVAALAKRTDLEQDSIRIQEMNRKKLPFSVICYRTVEEIDRLKDKFLKDNHLNLEHCFINASPNGFRGFYFYEEGQEYDQELYESIQKGIISVFDTDEAFKQGAQPARVSGFYHHKRTPTLVTTVRLPSGFVTVDEMTEKFITVGATQSEKEHIQNNGTRHCAHNHSKGTEKIEYKAEMVFTDAMDFLKQQLITDVYPDFSYKRNFVCVLHDDHTPSARLGIVKGNHLYGCYGCQRSLDLIDLYIELEKDGDRKQFEESVIELSDMFDIKIVESEFFNKQMAKYQRNQKWTVEMFDDGKMKEKYPVLYSKFFSRTVRYLKENQKIKVFKDGTQRWVGGKTVLDNKGNPVIRYQTASRREKVLKFLTLYANARLKDINVDGNSIFWISYEHIASMLLGESAERNDVVREKCRVIYVVKELELLGFIQQVPLDNVPEHIAKKAKSLTEVVHTSGKTYKKQVIKFYSMNDFYQIETESNQKAMELKSSGYKNAIHKGKNAMLIHQGEEIANKLFQDDRKLDDYYITVKNKLLRNMQKELNKKGFFFKQEIINPKFTLMIDHKRKYVTKQDKSKVIDMFLYGTNGIMEELRLKEKRLTLKVVDDLAIDQQTYQMNKHKYIYIKRG